MENLEVSFRSGLNGIKCIFLCERQNNIIVESYVAHVISENTCTRVSSVRYEVYFRWHAHSILSCYAGTDEQQILFCVSKKLFGRLKRSATSSKE